MVKLLQNATQREDGQSANLMRSLLRAADYRWALLALHPAFT
jgi:hypothetical protein